MPLTIHEIKSYDEHQNLINSLRDKVLICWYVGASIPHTGQSWCGDCRNAEPVIREFLDNLKIRNDQDVHVIHTEIDKDYFRGSDCDFKKDQNIKLQKVPTLLSLLDKKLLVERECLDKSLLEGFFANVRA